VKPQFVIANHLLKQLFNCLLPTRRAGFQQNCARKRVRTPSEFLNFGGAVSGRDFERKNATMWELNSDGRGEIGTAVLEASPAAQQPVGRLIEVSRVDFDLWRKRSVLMYARQLQRVIARISPYVCGIRKGVQTAQACANTCYLQLFKFRFTGHSSGCGLANKSAILREAD